MRLRGLGLASLDDRREAPLTPIRSLSNLKMRLEASEAFGQPWAKDLELMAWNIPAPGFDVPVLDNGDKIIILFHCFDICGAWLFYQCALSGGIMLSRITGTGL